MVLCLCVSLLYFLLFTHSLILCCPPSVPLLLPPLVLFPLITHSLMHSLIPLLSSFFYSLYEPLILFPLPTYQSTLTCSIVPFPSFRSSITFFFTLCHPVYSLSTLNSLTSLSPSQQCHQTLFWSSWRWPSTSSCIRERYTHRQSFSGGKSTTSQYR